MSQYIRAQQKGGTFFFTVVTYQRQTFLLDERIRMALRSSINEVREMLPFSIDAWVLLPDHIHCIWTLPDEDSNYSKRWGLIKRGVSVQVKGDFHRADLMSKSKVNKRESTLWQRRFWEHQISNEKDLKAHMDYLHYNPVKHGLVSQLKDWPFSSFHRYVKQGLYEPSWGNEYSFTGGYGE